MGIIDLLFPRKCLGCGKVGSYFCSHCLNFVSSPKVSLCPECERPSIGGVTHTACMKINSLDGLTTIFTYSGLISKAIVKLKYRFVTDLAEELVDLLLSFCGEDSTFSLICQKKELILIPIPLHEKRKNWRGFNQTEILGKMVAKSLNLDYDPELLFRVKRTVSQTQLNAKGRHENIKRAFSSTGTFRSKNFLLFDDVWTSGATMKEAAKTLKKKGAGFVWGLTLAR